MQLYCCHRIWHACFRMQISHYAIASLVKYFSENKYIHQKLGRVSFRVDGSALWQLRDHPVLFNKLFQVTLRVERSSYWICTTNLPQHRTSCTCWSHPLKGKLGQTELAAAGAPRAVGLPGTTLPSLASCPRGAAGPLASALQTPAPSQNLCNTAQVPARWGRERKSCCCFLFQFNLQVL